MVQSDPICSSAGCDHKKKAPADETVYYPDPATMETEEDVADSEKHLAASEVQHARKWVWDDSEEYGTKWINNEDSWNRAVAEPAAGSWLKGHPYLHAQRMIQREPTNDIPKSAGPVQDQHNGSQASMLQREPVNDVPKSAGPVQDQHNGSQASMLQREPANDVPKSAGPVQDQHNGSQASMLQREPVNDVPKSAGPVQDQHNGSQASMYQRGPTNDTPRATIPNDQSNGS